MKIFVGGWKELSLVDVLESTSFTVWFSFCNFRCPWCSNSRLARGAEKHLVDIEDIVELVVDAKDFVDYFHVTGGEPTLQYKALIELFKRVKEETGLPLSLDTNASTPDVLQKILSEVEVKHIAIDIKAPLFSPEKYARATGMPVSIMERMIRKIRRGVSVASQHASFLELRSTMAPGILDVEDVVEVAESITRLELAGNLRKTYVVQQFVPYEGVPDTYRRAKQTPQEKVVKAAEKAAEVLGQDFEVWYRTLKEGAKRIR